MIAIALACGPELLIADEPTTALDVTIQAQILALLAELKRESGMAMVLITHDFGAVAGVADRVAVMQAGRIVEWDSAVRVLQAPRHEYTRALLGKVESVCCDESDLEAVAREREEVARTAKILYARKDELERILKKRLEDVDRLELGGMVYSLGKTTQVSYPTAPTVALFREVLRKGDDELLPLLLSVDKAKVDGLVKELSKALPPADARLLKARLDAVAEKSVSPRFSAQRATTVGGAP